MTLDVGSLDKLEEERKGVIFKNHAQKIFGILHLPKKVAKAPCVIICHGLAGNKTGHYRIYVELAEALIKANIAVLRFDFRGSGDSEGNFQEMTIEGEVSDTLKALEFLKQSKKIDQEKIAILGRSFGGAIAIISAAAFKKIKSLVLWAPLYDGEDWRKLWEYVNSEAISEIESLKLRSINGQVASLDFYAGIFKMEIAKELKLLEKVPLFLIHGQKDTIISFSHTEKYLKARENSLAKTKLLKLSESDHNFSPPLERLEAIDQTVQWFKETLL